jgi:hypothetical protein
MLFIPGAIVLLATVTFTAGELQPKLLVTIKLYVPATFTLGVAELPPETIPGPLQLYVPPPLPDKPTIGVVQVIVGEEPAFAVGNATNVTVLVSV